MEGWRQIGGGLANDKENANGNETTEQRDCGKNTEMSACHFLQRDCMDLGHPSRLPQGSLRSAWTGPGRDPQGFTHTRKWQALYQRRWCASRWSAPNCCPSRAMKFNP
jgi:hypothetical protein